MQTRRTFPQRIGYHWACVAPAERILDDTYRMSDDEGEPLSLRDALSSDGLCHLRVLRSLHHGSLYLVHVAASPALLCSEPATVLLTEHQLSYALPFDVRLQNQMANPERICAILHAHAKAIQPTRRIIPEPVETVVPQPILAEPPTAQDQLEPEDAQVVTLTPIFISEKRMQKVLASMKPAVNQYAGKSSEAIFIMQRRQRWLETAFVRTALLVTERWREMHQVLRHVLHILPHVQQPLLNINEEYDPRGRRVGYWLRIGVPVPYTIPQSCVA